MTFKFDMSGLTALLGNAAGVKSRVMKKAYSYFVLSTPIKTGYARRNTRLSKDTIEANYPYATRLDNGYSKQAPKGMSLPTEQEIKRLVDEEIKRIK